MYQLAARTYKVSDLKVFDIITENFVQQNMRNDVIKLHLNCNKTSTVQDPLVYNNHDTVANDLYFAFFMVLVLDQKLEKYIFPEFARSTSKTGSNEYESKAATIWGKYYEKVTSMVKNIPGKYYLSNSKFIYFI